MTQCSQPPLNPPDIEALYPNGTAPEIRIPRVSAICSIGLTPLIVSGFLRQMLIQHFADPENILNATLRRYLEQNGVWHAQPPSGMYIEVVGRWKPQQMGQRPAIVIKEGDWSLRKTVIGDRSRTEWASGRQYFTSQWLCSHTIFALGHEGAETQILASEIAKLLVYFGPVIREELALHRWQLSQIGALSKLKEATENYVVPVTVGYIREENWHLTQEAPRLKKIRINLAELARFG